MKQNKCTIYSWTSRWFTFFNFLGMKRRDKKGYSAQGQYKEQLTLFTWKLQSIVKRWVCLNKWQNAFVKKSYNQQKPKKATDYSKSWIKRLETLKIDWAWPYLFAMKTLRSHDSEKITEKRTLLTWIQISHSFIIWEINLELKIADNIGPCKSLFRNMAFYRAQFVETWEFIDQNLWIY